MTESLYARNFLDGRIKRVLILGITDAIFVYSVFIIVAFLRKYLFTGVTYSMGIYWAAWGVPVLIVGINALFRLYHGSMFFPGFPINWVEEIRRLFFSSTLGYLIFYSFLMLTRINGEYSRIVLTLSWMITATFFPLSRYCVRGLMRKIHVGKSKVLIAGAGNTGRKIAEEINNRSYYGFNVVGFLDDDPQKENMEIIDGIYVIGKLSDAEEIGRKNDIDYIICCLPFNVLESIVRNYIKSFKYMVYVPTSNITPGSNAHVVSVGFMSGLEFKNQLKYVIPRITKQTGEIIISLIAMVVLLPLLLVLALVVKLSSPGPVFYVAKRLGFNGKTINVLKFRTMYKDAETRLKSILDENPELKAEWDKNFKLKNDPRITPLGNFMRKTSLDELPQFLNVLSGDMAIIGPRPIVADEIRYYGDNYEYFKQVKPGITGLWQVSGRSDTDYEQRVSLDMYYTMNWSLWLDYYIFFKTILVILKQRGAC